MPDFDIIDEANIIRTIKEWMIDDYAVSDIISQAVKKWNFDDAQANSLLEKATQEWKEKETENNEQKRLRKIDSLKKLKRSLKDTFKGTPAGITAILNVEKELFRLESLNKVDHQSIKSTPKKENELPGKQEAFCREYIVDFNGTQAYRRAGYAAKSDDTAAVEAFKLLRKPKIKKHIEKLLEDVRRRSELTTDIIVAELRDLADWNIQDFIQPDGDLKDLTELPLKTTKPVVGIKVTKRRLPDGSNELSTELKFTDKKGSWVSLGQHTGAFEKDNAQKKPVINNSTEVKVIKATLKL